MTNFADMKKARTNNLDKYEQKIKSMKQTYESTENKDEYWSITVDKTGCGEAEIRWLPPSPDEDVPFIHYYHHAFKGPSGRWYLEKSLTTLKKKDPVAETNSILWNEGGEEGRKIVQGTGKDNPGRKRKLTYVSNIYIVDDPAHPENNGKTFKFKYGEKLFEVLQSVMYPKRPKDPKFDPFDLWDGANFILDARNVAGYRNYDKSKFTACGPLLEDDKALKAVWDSQYKLQAEISPDKFKTYDELKALLDAVIGNSTTPSRDVAKAGRTAPAQQPKEETAPWEGSTEGAGDDDADIEFFKNLANG